MLVSTRASVGRLFALSFMAGVLAFAIPGLVWRGTTLEAGPVSDSQVKAAFLFNFAKFVQWPGPSDGPFVFGIAGDDDFAEIVTKTVRGRSVNGRELQTRRLVNGDDASGCQVVFVGVMRAHDQSEWLQRLRGPVLTVGETVQFLRDGGMVRFYIENKNVRFQINQKNAEVAGLKISSQLLTLAAR